MTAITRRARARGARSEDGVAAVFTIVVLFALLGIAALVLDLGGLRVQRAHDRGAADLAATAAAQSLSTSNGVDMVSACTEAWNYTLANISNATPVGSMPCSLNFSGACVATIARTATATAGRFTVTITNPVPDANPLMGTHTLGGVTQGINTSIDGKPCQRIGVTIAESHTSVFGQIFGTRSSTTTTSSVALASVGSTTPQAPGLLILEPSACNALTTSGTARIEVKDNGDAPGLLVVDSSGTAAGNSCNGRYTLDAGGNQSSIKADTSASSGAAGVIDLYALASGQNLHGYDPNDVPGQVSPQPVAESAPATRSLVDHKFNCKAAGYDGVSGNADDCAAATGTSDYIDQLHRLYDTSPPYNAPAVPVGVVTGQPAGAFTTYPRVGVPTDSCSPNGAAITLPAGNWYINCLGGFNVSNAFTIPSGTVVFAGAVNANGGVLTINPTGSPSTIAYIRAGTVNNPGNLTRGAQAGLIMNHTMVLLQQGVVSFGAGAPPLTWTAPHDAASHYDDLALWSESVNGHSIGGQGALTLEGVYFMPNAPFNFSGQGVQYQTTAQFVSLTLAASGQSALQITPDPSRGFTIPNVGNRLIR
ncbi:MAG: hypothetical protein QOH10_35 [Actinomycetota bacterium]|nr:hypothetical protein [Actinomycetota bacterium]